MWTFLSNRNTRKWHRSCYFLSWIFAVTFSHAVNLMVLHGVRVRVNGLNSSHPSLNPFVRLSSGLVAALWLAEEGSMTERGSELAYFGDVTDYENEDYDTDDEDYLTWRPLLNRQVGQWAAKNFCRCLMSAAQSIVWWQAVTQLPFLDRSLLGCRGGSKILVRGAEQSFNPGGEALSPKFVQNI